MGCCASSDSSCELTPEEMQQVAEMAVARVQDSQDIKALVPLLVAVHKAAAAADLAKLQELVRNDEYLAQHYAGRGFAVPADAPSTAMKFIVRNTSEELGKDLKGPFGPKLHSQLPEYLPEQAKDAAVDQALLAIASSAVAKAVDSMVSSELHKAPPRAE
jgi:hypothetical protein